MHIQAYFKILSNQMLIHMVCNLLFGYVNHICITHELPNWLPKIFI